MANRFLEIRAINGWGMAAEKNPLNAWILFATPIFIFLSIYQLVPAISERLITDWIGLVIYMIVAVLIGIALFRNSRTVRDHEWHRRKHIKNLQKDYAAEDRGVWSKADLAMSELEADARGVESGLMSQKALNKLDGSIGGLTGERLTGEVENTDQDQDNVALFTESEHVRRSTARVTGETGPVESVVGVTHAQAEPEKGLIGGVLDRLKENQTAIPGNVGLATSPAPATSQDDWYSQEMQGVTTTGQAPNVMPQTGNSCGSCGHLNPDGEAYCENCGNKI